MGVFNLRMPDGTWKVISTNAAGPVGTGQLKLRMPDATWALHAPHVFSTNPLQLDTGWVWETVLWMSTVPPGALPWRIVPLIKHSIGGGLFVQFGGRANDSYDIEEPGDGPSIISNNGEVLPLNLASTLLAPGGATVFKAIPGHPGPTLSRGLTTGLLDFAAHTRYLDTMHPTTGEDGSGSYAPIIHMEIKRVVVQLHLTCTAFHQTLGLPSEIAPAIEDVFTMPTFQWSIFTSGDTAPVIGHPWDARSPAEALGGIGDVLYTRTGIGTPITRNAFADYTATKTVVVTRTFDGPVDFIGFSFAIDPDTVPAPGSTTVTDDFGTYSYPPAIGATMSLTCSVDVHYALPGTDVPPEYF